MAVDGAVEGVVVLAEHAIAELRTGPGHAGHLRQGHEQVELGAREPDVLAGAPDLARGLVDLKVEIRARRVGGRRRDGGPRHRREAPEHGTHAGDELARLEGLGDVVVGADLEARHPVDDVVASGEHDDRGPPTGGAELAQDVEPRAPGKHDVEDDQVRLVLERRRECRIAVAGVPDLVALAGKVGPHDLADVGLIVDDQDAAHGAGHRRAGSRRRRGRPPDRGAISSTAPRWPAGRCRSRRPRRASCRRGPRRPCRWHPSRHRLPSRAWSRSGPRRPHRRACHPGSSG